LNLSAGVHAPKHIFEIFLKFCLYSSQGFPTIDILKDLLLKTVSVIERQLVSEGPLM